MSIQAEIDKAIKEKRLYFIGDKLPSDWYEAFRLWLPLAEAGDPKAQYNIGRCYACGDGVDEEIAKAIDWFLKAAAQGEPRAHYNLYAEYSNKDSAKKDDAKAAEWLTKAAELGEPRALKQIENNSFNELRSLAKNSLAAGDKDKARELFKQLADKGDADAELGLVACDVDISFEETTTTKYYSYDVPASFSPGYVSGGVVIHGVHSGGYKATNSDEQPTVVFKVKNNSPKVAIVSVNIETYDYDHPEKKIGEGEELYFTSLKPGEVAEVRREMYIPEGSDGILVYFTGYRILRKKHGDNIDFPLPSKVLVFQWSERLEKEKIQRREEKERRARREKYEEKREEKNRKVQAIYFWIILAIGLGFGSYYGVKFYSNWEEAREHDLEVVAEQKARDEHDGILKQYGAVYPEAAAWHYAYENCYGQSKNNPNISIKQNMTNKSEQCNTATTKKLGPYPVPAQTFAKFQEEHRK